MAVRALLLLGVFTGQTPAGFKPPMITCKRSVGSFFRRSGSTLRSLRQGRMEVSIIMQVPIHVRKRQTCQRCGLNYDIDEPSCVHCAELSDTEVEALKERYREEQEGNHQLGLILICLAGFVTVVMVLALLA